MALSLISLILLRFLIQIDIPLPALRSSVKDCARGPHWGPNSSDYPYRGIGHPTVVFGAANTVLSQFYHDSTKRYHIKVLLSNKFGWGNYSTGAQGIHQCYRKEGRQWGRGLRPSTSLEHIQLYTSSTSTTSIQCSTHCSIPGKSMLYVSLEYDQYSIQCYTQCSMQG